MQDYMKKGSGSEQGQTSAATSSSSSGGGADGQTSAASASATVGGGSAVPPSGIIQFSYDELKKATGNFSNTSYIGAGRTWTIYKGILERPRRIIAVRVQSLVDLALPPPGETTMLPNLDHPNIIKLIGYCYEGEEPIVVYDFMLLGSLHSHLHGVSGSAKMAVLDWKKRLRIAAGVARGLNYLHNEVDPPILLANLKSSNILLDNGFNPILSNFSNATRVNDQELKRYKKRLLNRWNGYMAPEFLLNRKHTIKTEVYTFGIVLLELITGALPKKAVGGNLKNKLIDFACAFLKPEAAEGLEFLADLKMKKRDFSDGSLRKAVEITVMCLQDDPESRPNMNKVVEALNPLASPNTVKQKCEMKKFSYGKLKSATKKFSDNNLVGQGHFGCTYRGTLKKTGQIIAVRRYNPSAERKFRVEIKMLSVLHHPNLINLVGSCAERNHYYAVYDFMPMGSLKSHLSDATKAAALDWNKRMKIAAGVAAAMNYLHNEANPPVIFRDLKSTNILLDKGFNPKLSDFGDAKLVTDDDSQPAAMDNRTGYAAPEYVNTGEHTIKSDIYSFGILLLELISGNEPVGVTLENRKNELIDTARELLSSEQSGIVFCIADSRVPTNFSEDSIREVLEVALMCVEDDPEFRPNLNSVVEKFNLLAASVDDNPKEKGGDALDVQTRRLTRMKRVDKRPIPVKRRTKNH